MTAPRLKICGITRLEDARYCAAAGADYLGFIQYEKSPRYVAPQAAKSIIDWLYGPEPVGVFVDAPADFVNESAQAAGFALVQLHGDESPETCAAIELPVIKAIRVRDGWTHRDLREAMLPFAGIADYFLLDNYSSASRGGTGESFDWGIAGDVAEEFRIFLAGGLGESNVEAAVAKAQPFAIDLSSSVEIEPGIKDVDKLARFFDAFAAVKSEED